MDGTLTATLSASGGRTITALKLQSTGPGIWDTNASSPFWVYVEQVAAHGVVGGYTDGTYRPTNRVTRGQTAKFIGNGFFPGCTTAR